MANYATLKAAIQAVIKQNGTNDITGNILQQTLLSMIESLGANYQFAGIATTTTNPGSPDQNVCYFAFDIGTYTNFGSTQIAAGQIGIFTFNGSWSYSVKTIFAVVNDLTTGGTDKALSAQMGIRLLEKINDVYSVISLNMFDKTTISVGYVSVESGVLVPNESYRSSDYIRVIPGIGYRIRNNTNYMVCFYDADHNFISAYTSSNAFNITAADSQIPATAYFARFTMTVSDVDNAGFYNALEYLARNAWEDILNYETGIVADKLKGQIVERQKTVGTMAALLQVLATIIDTDNYHYTIYLQEGTYVLTPAQIDAIETVEYGRIGILLPNNVDLVGQGKGATITCDLTGEESGYQQYISPINIKWNNRLKNLTVVANNCRYAVHADNSNAVQNVVWEIEDCTFIHYGNSDGAWNYSYAWGVGSCSGQIAKFRNCTFRGPAAGFYMHNNVGFTIPAYYEFNGCKFISTGHARAFAAESMGSGTKDVICFNGCSFDGIFDSRIGSGAPSGTIACDYVVIGSGNSPVCENWYYNDGVPYHSIFGDEVIAFINETGAALSAGAFMKYDSDHLVPMQDGDDGKVFVGFLLDNVADGGVGYVKIHGSYRVTTPSSVVWATLGTRVKVENYNTLGVASDIYNIGKMYYRNTVYSRYFILLD